MKQNYHLVINDDHPYGSTVTLKPLLIRKPTEKTVYQNLFLKTVYLGMFAITLTLVAYIFLSIYNPKGFPFPPEKKIDKNFEKEVQNFNASYELEHIRLFDEFKYINKKKYPSLKEEAERFSIFREEYQKAQKYAQRQENMVAFTKFGINGLSDMSEEEFTQMLLPIGWFDDMKEKATFIKFRSKKGEQAVEKSLDDYPSSFDWREQGVITPVKAQRIDGAGYCGSCWSFASAATVEAAHAIKYGLSELRNLSTQQLLDCDLDDDGCGGGEPEKAFRYIYEHGLTTWESYPYIAEDWHNNTCKLPEIKPKETTKFEVAYFLHPDEVSIIDWLINFGPVNVAINVPPDMKAYTGGIYKPSDYDCIFKLIGTHALNLIGYNTTEEGEKYWIVKNSWGTSWGVEHGYIHFARGINTCGIEDKPIGLIG